MAGSRVVDAGGPFHDRRRPQRRVPVRALRRFQPASARRHDSELTDAVEEHRAGSGGPAAAVASNDRSSRNQNMSQQFSSKVSLSEALRPLPS